MSLFGLKTLILGIRQSANIVAQFKNFLFYFGVSKSFRFIIVQSKFTTDLKMLAAVIIREYKTSKQVVRDSVGNFISA